ncbi:terminase large subunit [Cereibacter sphaeroides]|nr:terminase large subunit [Cereibacter sphaeroides]
MAVAVRATGWSTAVPDWKDRIRAGESLLPDLPLCEENAARALDIFQSLRVPDLRGQPTFGEVGEPWIFDLVRVIFGAIDGETRARVLREFFVMIAKKNTKTTIAAAIIVTGCLMNETPYHEFVLVAPTINIAAHAYKQAKGIIEISVLSDGTALKPLFHSRDQLRQIELLNKALPSSIAIKAADTDVVTGFKNGSALIDELHELALKANAEAIMLEIAGAMASPENSGFMLTITTQSKKAPAGAFKAALNVARGVRDGKLNLPLLPLIYEMPAEDTAEDGWRDRSKWRMSNPNLGRSVSMGFLEEELAKADMKGPEAVQLFASQHLNVEVGASLHGDAWAGARYWDLAAEPGLNLDELLRRCEVVVAGIDGGGLDDLCSLALIGRETGSRRWLHWGKAWAQPDVLIQRPQIVSRLQDFEKDGDLLICKETDEADQEIAEICARVQAAGLFPEEQGIGLDAYGVAAILDALAEKGLEEPLTTAVPQGYKLQSAINTLPRKVKDRTFRHCGQPFMAWAVGNAKAELKGSNIVVTKQAAGAAKIDPFMATMNAAMLMLANPVAAGAGAFVYEGM